MPIYLRKRNALFHQYVHEIHIRFSFEKLMSVNMVSVHHCSPYCNKLKLNIRWRGQDLCTCFSDKELFAVYYHHVFTNLRSREQEEQGAENNRSKKRKRNTCKKGFREAWELFDTHSMASTSLANCPLQSKQAFSTSKGCSPGAWRSQLLSMSLSKPQVPCKCSPPAAPLQGHGSAKLYSNANTADCPTWQLQFLAATVCFALETNTTVRTISHSVDQRKSLAELTQC